jgi:hypothetical protein
VSLPQAKNLGLLILQTAIFASVYKYLTVLSDTYAKFCAFMINQNALA